MPSDSQMNRKPFPGRRCAAYGTTSPKGTNGSGTCSVISRRSKSVQAARCGRDRYRRGLADTRYPRASGSPDNMRRTSSAVIPGTSDVIRIGRAAYPTRPTPGGCAMELRRELQGKGTRRRWGWEELSARAAGGALALDAWGVTGRSAFLGQSSWVDVRKRPLRPNRRGHEVRSEPGARPARDAQRRPPDGQLPPRRG